jgi:hypothetical protein
MERLVAPETLLPTELGAVAIYAPSYARQAESRHFRLLRPSHRPLAK